MIELAIAEAKKATKHGEVPIGAVIVRGGAVIAKAYNLREKKQNAIYHAETLAIMRACKKLKSWRLDDCEMYVTLEPCMMCMGAITNARLRAVYFGAASNSNLNWKAEVKNLENEECSKMLKDFFGRQRTLAKKQ